MLDRLSHCASSNGGLWVILGDFNSVSSPADRLRCVDGTWQQASEQRDKSLDIIEKRFGKYTELAPGNFAYCTDAVLTMLDKALVSLSPAQVLAYNVQISTSTSSCKVSDHLPVVLQLGTSSKRESGFDMVLIWFRVGSWLSRRLKMLS